MSFIKKQKYFSSYLKSINRKVSYTEPIFLLDVQFADNVNIYKTGGAELSIPLPVKITSSKELLFNIAQFADLDASKKEVSKTLRNIVLNKPIGNLESIAPKLTAIYKMIFETYNIKKYESVEFAQDPYDSVDKLIDKKVSSIAVVDFNVFDEPAANISAIIKQVFFKYAGGHIICSNKKDLVNYMKTKKIQSSN